MCYHTNSTDPHPFPLTRKSNSQKDIEIFGWANPSGNRYTPYTYTLEMSVKSETFAECPEGQEPPQIEPFIYTVHTEQQKGNG